MPDNQAGGTGTEARGQVLPFTGEWFGPRDELVPFGPRARVHEGAAAEGAAAGRNDPATDTNDAGEGGNVAGACRPPTKSDADGDSREHGPAGRPHVVAEDFWGGLADAGDLIQFPAEPVGGVGPRVPRQRPVRLVAAATILSVALIGVRVWTGSGAGSDQAGAALAQTAISAADLPIGGVGVDQQTRDVPLRIRASVPLRPWTHPPRTVSRRVLVSQSRSSTARSQPVVYSTPAPTQQGGPSVTGKTASFAGSGAAGAGGSRSGGGGSGSGGSGGGGSHRGGARRTGPRGAAAAFGPGKMGG